MQENALEAGLSPRVSGSIGPRWDQECAFPTTSQVLLLPLLGGLHIRTTLNPCVFNREDVAPKEVKSGSWRRQNLILFIVKQIYVQHINRYTAYPWH